MADMSENSGLSGDDSSGDDSSRHGSDPDNESDESDADRERAGSDEVDGSASDQGFVSTAGHLLVSVPGMLDDNFDRTVVFMVEHDTNGALGLVLNRPSTMTVAENLPVVIQEVVTPQVFFVGGPVAVGGLLVLGRRSLDAEMENATPLSGPIAVVDPEALINNRVRGVEALRVFTGYSGWGPGQLDGEIEMGAWYVFESMVDDVLCVDPDRLWRSVMKRQGGKLAGQSFFPENLNVN